MNVQCRSQGFIHTYILYDVSFIIEVPEWLLLLLFLSQI